MHGNTLTIIESLVSAKISKIASKEAWNNDLEPQDVSGLKFFEMNTIQTATDNFSLSNKLGQGGFGSVYKVGDFFSFLCFYVFAFMFTR